MNRCPGCGFEYSDGALCCPGCKRELFGPSSPPGARQETEYSFLTNVADPVLISLLKTKLEAFGIPCDLRYKGISQYMTLFLGSSVEGADLYVPTEFLSEAREIIKPDPIE